MNKNDKHALKILLPLLSVRWKYEGDSDSVRPFPTCIAKNIFMAMWFGYGHYRKAPSNSDAYLCAPNKSLVHITITLCSERESHIAFPKGHKGALFL